MCEQADRDPLQGTARAFRREAGNFNYQQRKEERDFCYSWVSTARGKSRVFPFIGCIPPFRYNLFYSQKCMSPLSTRIQLQGSSALTPGLRNPPSAEPWAESRSDTGEVSSRSVLTRACPLPSTAKKPGKIRKCSWERINSVLQQPGKKRERCVYMFFQE